MKFLMAALFASSMANAQNAEVKTISAQDLPKSSEWAETTRPGLIAQKTTGEAWLRKKVKVLGVIITDSSWTRESGKSTLKHGLVYGDDKGNVYYTSGLTASNSGVGSDSTERVDDILPKPEYMVSDFATLKNVDCSNLKQISKTEIPDTTSWGKSTDGMRASYWIMNSLVDHQKYYVANVLVDDEGWKVIRDEGSFNRIASVKYTVVYKEDRDSNDVFIAHDQVAYGIYDIERERYTAYAGYNPIIPEGLVPDYFPKKYTSAELDTIKSIKMENFPRLSSHYAEMMSYLYQYARYNINDDVLEVFPKTENWVQDGKSEKIDFDMIHKRDDGKVVYTYGYSVTRKDAENYDKAKAWKKKMHEIDISDWDNEKWLKECSSANKMWAERPEPVKMADLPKDAMKDPALNKGLMAWAKKHYPTVKKVIVRSPSYQYTRNYLGQILNRYVEFDIIYLRKTNVYSKVVYRNHFLVKQNYNGRTYDKNWVGMEPNMSYDYPIVDWK